MSELCEEMLSDAAAAAATEISAGLEHWNQLASL